ncbi:MAG: hypothetical protein IKR13_03575, partial [Victivallales bacterium]|nr:hypothetical protein [Victivallales bacterium]
WMLYRYNPAKEKHFTLDSKPPVMPYKDFLDGETRYAALKRTFPENAEKFFAQGENDAQVRYQHYKHLEDNQ